MRYAVARLCNLFSISLADKSGISSVKIQNQIITQFLIMDSMDLLMDPSIIIPGKMLQSGYNPICKALDLIILFINIF